MRRIAVLGVVSLLLGGCAIGAVDDEPVGEVPEALPFSIWQRTRVGATVIHVTQGGNVMATITGLHLRPRGCSKVKAAHLILSKLGATADVKPVDLPAREIAPDGATKIETWNNLKAGNHALFIDPIGQVPECRWEGDVFTESH
jgi:hypothetical protein